MTTIKLLTARQIARHLATLGLPVLSVSEPDGEVDGSVELTPLIHVQVGDCYMNLVRETGDECFEFYPSRKKIQQIAADYRAALAKVQ